MRGTVYRRDHPTKKGKKSTLYYAVVETKGPDGKRHQDWGRGFRRRTEADAELTRKLSAGLRTPQSSARADLSYFRRDGFKNEEALIAIVIFNRRNDMKIVAYAYRVG